MCLSFQLLAVFVFQPFFPLIMSIWVLFGLKVPFPPLKPPQIVLLCPEKSAVSTLVQGCTKLVQAECKRIFTRFHVLSLSLLFKHSVIQVSLL